VVRFAAGMAVGVALAFVGAVAWWVYGDPDPQEFR
jgi:hypothetical protein